MMKHTTLISTALLAIILAVVGIAYAYFSATATSTNNTFETADMTIALSDGNESQSEHITQTWSASGLMPGDILPSSLIQIENLSSFDADHLDITFAYTGSEDIARSMMFMSGGTGFRYGSGADDSVSVNLSTALRGGSDVDFTITKPNGDAITATSIDGIDGTVRDNNISLSELATFGTFRINPADESAGMSQGSYAYLWLNAYMSNALSAQNESVDVSITAKLDQHSSQI